MNKKGFTLIELLAVIVILAIILLIAMPIVLNVINEARRKAFESTAQGLGKAAETEFYRRSLASETTLDAVYYVFDAGTQSTLSSLPSGPSDAEELEYSGQAPDNGVIYVASNGEIEYWFYDGNYCAVKGTGVTEPTVSEENTLGDCEVIGLEIP